MGRNWSLAEHLNCFYYMITLHYGKQQSAHDLTDMTITIYIENLKNYRDSAFCPTHQSYKMISVCACKLYQVDFAYEYFNACID